MTDGFSFRQVDFDPFVPAAERAIELPLTEAQAEMWTAAEMGREANCSYNQCFVFTLRGPLHVESLQAALDRVLARHDALRTVVARDGSGQTVRPPFGFELPVVDVSGLSEAERAAELERLVGETRETPFDLAEGPLVRAFVLRESPDRHRLVFTAHHIVCDGWSSAVLFSDLGKLYTADRVGIPAQLEDAASYQEYVVGQASDEAVAAAAADEEYWAERYTDGAPVLDLPVTSRPAVKTYASRREELRIGEELYVALKQAGTRSGVTLFATLLAAFEVLVERLSGQTDFVVGIPLADQPTLENTALVAHCVSTVPFRARVDPGARFTEHVRAVGRDLGDAQEHAKLTFGSLLRRLRVPRDRSRTPLVSVTFSLDRIGAPFDFGDVLIDAVETPKDYSNFELALNVVDDGSGLVVECDYNVDLYDEDIVRRWLGHYETLLRGIAADPETTLEALPLLDEAERLRALVEWNDTDEAFPDERRLDRLFEAQVDRTPEADAVVDESERVSYAELDRRANRLAHRLRALGVGPDVLVGVCLERSVELVVALLAVAKAGGAYVPLDPDYPAPRLALMVEDSECFLILTRREIASELPAGAPLLVLEDEEDTLAAEPTTRPPAVGTPTDLAYVIYTSGSTGQPNGVQIEHAAAANHMLWMRAQLPFEPSDRVLQRTPLSFDASVWEVFAPLSAGACVVMAPADARRAVAELAEVVAEHGVTILQLVPSFAQAVLEDLNVAACASLRRVLCGGEQLPASLYRDLRERLGVDVVNLYGPTEACIDATWWPTTDAVRDGTADRVVEARRAVPIGRPISNCRAYVLDERHEPVPTEVRGELYLGGAGLARGYLRRPELTAERFVTVSPGGGPEQRLYRTGDLVRQLADGTIEYLGRRDHQVKLRGHRIELGEIEATLRRQPGVTDAVAVVREDRPGDLRLVAYVVSAESGEGVGDALRDALRLAVPEYLVPSHFVVLDALPLAPNGKVDRRALPAPARDRPQVDSAGTAPRTPTEAAVAVVWQDALDVDTLGVEDDFFEAGGHSLIAARIVTQLRSSFGVDIGMRHLFERPTIAGLAEIVDVLAVTTAAPTSADHLEREQIEI